MCCLDASMVEAGILGWKGAVSWTVFSRLYLWDSGNEVIFRAGRAEGKIWL